MTIWAAFFKTGSTDIKESLSRIGLHNYRPSSQKCNVVAANRKMNNNNLFVGMTTNEYLILLDLNYSLIANETKDINTLDREKQLSSGFLVEEVLKFYYDGNINSHAFSKTINGKLVRFVYKMDEEVRLLEGNPIAEEPLSANEENTFNNIDKTIENIMFKVFGKIYYAEYGGLDEVEVQEFIIDN
jgi:hypothetical protein